MVLQSAGCCILVTPTGRMGGFLVVVPGHCWILAKLLGRAVAATGGALVLVHCAHYVPAKHIRSLLMGAGLAVLANSGHRGIPRQFAAG